MLKKINIAGFELAPLIHKLRHTFIYRYKIYFIHRFLHKINIFLTLWAPY